MQDLSTGMFDELSGEDAARLRRIFEAGNRDVPIFEVGEEITIREGRFRVLALDRRLMVLEGVPRSR